MTLHLPHVTVVAIDTEEHRLTRAALDDTLNLISPAAVHIYADDHRAYHMLDANTVIQFPTHRKLNTEEIYKTLWYTVPTRVTTSHVLTIQWDGWVIDETQWSDEFLQYDYIGAPWPWHKEFRVGNGGFSLRSVQLLKTLKNSPVAFPFRLPCDDVICRAYRPWLEDRGMRFAPETLAWQFSREYESVIWRGSTPPAFGFHEVHNWKRVLGKRFAERLSLAGPYAQRKLHELESFHEIMQRLQMVRVSRRIRQMQSAAKYEAE